MRVKINIKKLSNSLNQGDKTDSIFINRDTIDQIKGYILSNNKDCIILSGYRGVGKTCVINGLQDLLAKEKCIFIKLNCTEYKNQEITIRKLIREIYFEITKRDILKDNGNTTKCQLFIEKINNLFEKTFYEVTHNNHTSKHILKTIQTKVKMNITKAIIFLGILIGFNINIATNFIKMPAIASYIIYGLDLVCLIFELIQIVWITERKEENVDAIDRKSLYDEEIAEYHFRDILNDLNQLEYNVIIVLDELDKIEDKHKINKILSDFKPLFLSRLANFIIISGQTIYYELINADFLEDAMISSIFSKSYYINLPEFDFFSNLLSYAIEKKLKEPEILELYTKSKVLKSNWVVRRFINSIIQDTRYENNNMYLIIDSKQLEKLKFDAKLFDIGMEIYSNSIKKYPGISTVKKNFYKYQLFLWINKIINVNGNTFDNSYITKTSETSTNILNNLLLSKMKDSLLKKFIELGLVEEKVNDKDVIYEYVGNGPEYAMKENIASDNIQNFVQKMDKLIKYYRYIYNVDFDVNDNTFLKSEIFNTIDNTIKVYFAIYKKILNGDFLSDSEILNINNLDYRIVGSEKLIVEFLAAYAKRYFSKVNYDISYNSANDYNSKYDFSIYPGNFKSICHVEVKYMRHFSPRIVENIKYAISKFQDINSKLIVLLYISEYSYTSYDKMKQNLDTTFDKEIGKFNSNIKIIMVRESDYLKENNLDMYFNQMYDWLNSNNI